MQAIPKKPNDSKANPRFAFFMRRVWDFVFGGQFPIKGEGGTVVTYKDGSYWIRSGTIQGTSKKTGNPTDWFLGDWHPAMAVKAQQAVLYTPAGGHSGMYICISDAPIGWIPSNAAYYAAVPVGVPGVWG